MDAIITAIIGLLTGGAGAAIVSGLFARRKSNADTNRVSSDAWKEFAEKMEKRQEELDNENKEIRKENNEIRAIQKRMDNKLERYAKRIIHLTKGIEVLVNQIIEDGKQPCWNLDDWDPEEEE